MTKALAETRHSWGLVWLLCAVMCISFIDRGNLSVAAPVLGQQLGLSAWEIGLLLSAFFWTYSPSLIGSGWLVDRLGTRYVYAAGFLIWSIATICASRAESFTGLLWTRLTLGVGESVTYPANSRILASCFSEEKRGLANAITDLGARLGPLLGTMFGALLVAKSGWRLLFLTTGAAGLLWLIPWMILAPRTGALPQSGDAAASSWAHLLRRREVWGTCGGLFGANYTWYFFLSWLPSYLVRERGLTMVSLALWGALPYLFMSITLIGGGYWADRLIAAGRSAIRVRRGFLVTGLVMAAALMPSILLPRIEWALAGLFMTCLAFGVYVSNLWAMTQTLAGPQMAGRWTGVQNACGNLAGVLSPVLTGWLVTRTGRFALAFLAASLACFLGAASFGFLIRDENGQGSPDVARMTIPSSA